MTSQQLTNHYLQHMGIIPWRYRYSPHVCCSWQLPHCVITLRACIQGESAAQQRLLWHSICDIFRYCKVIEPITNCGFEFIFGNDSSLVELSEKKVVTYSLAELIAQPRLKIEVWDVLKCKIDC